MAKHWNREPTLIAELQEGPIFTALGDAARHDANPDLPRWYAVYTWARHEKMVARHFEERGIAHFLPLYWSVRRWNKRVARVSLPLFPGYIFVQTSWQDRYQALEVPGVVHFIGAAKSPTEIPAEQVEVLRNAMLHGRRVEPHPYLAPGNRVLVASGPMAGVTGVIERTTSGCRIIISVDMIKRSVAVELDSAMVIAESPSTTAASASR